MKHEEQIFNDIVSSIEHVTGIPAEEFVYVKTRKRDVVLLKSILINMLREELGWTQKEIRDKLQYKNHTTILYSLKKSQIWHDMDNMYRRELKLFNLVKEHYGQKHTSSI